MPEQVCTVIFRVRWYCLRSFEVTYAHMLKGINNCDNILETAQERHVSNGKLTGSWMETIE